MKNSGRLLELDAFRGLAVIAVILYHYSTRYGEIFGHIKTDYKFDFSYGHMGVQLFFIISGFVIFMSIERAKSPEDFLIKRAIRLYPAYIFAVLLTFAITSLYPLDHLKVSFLDLLVNLTMFHGYFPFIKPVDGAYWSLRVEVLFYIAMSILLFFNLLKRTIPISLVVLSLGSIFSLAYKLTDSTLIYNLNQVLIVSHIHLFIAGIMFYKLWKEKNQQSYYVILLLCLVYQFAFVGAAKGVYVTLFFMLFLLMINSKLTWVANKPFLFLGKISYSFYLVHQFIGYVIIHWLESIGFVQEYNIIVPIIITFILAIFVTNYIEIPMQNILRNKYKARKTKISKNTKAS